MKVARIVLFGLFLVAVRIIVGILVTLYALRESIGSEIADEVKEWMALSQFVALPLVFAMFAWLGKVQNAKPYLHALASVALAMFLESALACFIIGMGYFSFAVAVDYSITLLVVLIGTTVGIGIRKQRKR